MENQLSAAVWDSWRCSPKAKVFIFANEICGFARLDAWDQFRPARIRVRFRKKLDDETRTSLGRRRLRSCLRCYVALSFKYCFFFSDEHFTTERRCFKFEMPNLFGVRTPCVVRWSWRGVGIYIAVGQNVNVTFDIFWCIEIEAIERESVQRRPWWRPGPISIRRSTNLNC